MQHRKSTGSNARMRLLMYMLTATSAVVMGGALLLAQIHTDNDFSDAKTAMVLLSVAYAGVAGWLGSMLGDK